MARQGYIKLYRQIVNTAIWCDSDKLKLWMLCLLKASHDARDVITGNSIVRLDRGQFLTGRDALENEFNHGVRREKRVSGKTLFRYLEMFAQLQMLSIKKSNKYTIVTVLNWDKYQYSCPEDVPKVSSDCPESVQVLSTNKNEKNIYIGPFDRAESLICRTLNQNEFMRVKNLVDVHGADEVEKVINAAIEKNKRSISYVETVLNNRAKEKKAKEGAWDEYE